jgi:hypothetical protein
MGSVRKVSQNTSDNYMVLVSVSTKMELKIIVYSSEMIKKKTNITVFCLALAVACRKDEGVKTSKSKLHDQKKILVEKPSDDNYSEEKACLSASSTPLKAQSPYLTEQELLTVAHAYRDLLHDCLCLSAIKMEHSIHDKVYTKFRLDKLGLVDDVQFSSSSVKDPLLKQCVQYAMQSWRFPMPRGPAPTIALITLDIHADHLKDVILNDKNVQILSDGVPIKQSEVKPLSENRSVHIKRNKTFSILLNNPTPEAYALRASVGGRNTLVGSKKKFDNQAKWVVPAKGQLVISGWQVDEKNSEPFSALKKNSRSASKADSINLLLYRAKPENDGMVKNSLIVSEGIVPDFRRHPWPVVRGSVQNFSGSVEMAEASGVSFKSTGLQVIAKEKKSNFKPADELPTKAVKMEFYPLPYKFVSIEIKVD